MENIHFFKGELNEHYPLGEKWKDHKANNTPTLFVMRYANYESQAMQLLLATLHERKDLLHHLVYKPSGHVDWDSLYSFAEYAHFFLCLVPKETEEVVRPAFSFIYPYHYPKLLDIAYQSKFVDLFAEITDCIAKYRDEQSTDRAFSEMFDEDHELAGAYGKTSAEPSLIHVANSCLQTK